MASPVASKVSRRSSCWVNLASTARYMISSLTCSQSLRSGCSRDRPSRAASEGEEARRICPTSAVPAKKKSGSVRLSAARIHHRGDAMAAAPLKQFVRRLRSVLGGRRADGSADADLLIRYARDRDERAFEALLHRHGDM